MNSFAPYPAKYLAYNQQLSKNLIVVMEIEGLDTLFGIGETFTQVRYGDPNIVYGEPGLVYGGLRRISSMKPYMVLDSSFVIQQRIEPEQGKGDIGTLNITLIDYNGEVSRIVSPGIVIPEIIFKPQIRIWIGFAQTSFPEDFVLLFQGYVTQVVCPVGKVQLQLSDATAKKRQPLFNTSITNLTAPVDDSQTTINVVGTADLYMAVQAGNGTYDPQVLTYVFIDSEAMLYNSVSGLTTTTIVVDRGELGTATDAHDAGSEVSNTLLLGSRVAGIHFITLCLKLMLSGWNGPCEEDIPISSIGYVPTDASPVNSAAFVLASQDAVRDLGLSVGDYFTVTSTSNPANDLSGVITGFEDAILTNQVILTDQTFIQENVSVAVGAFRSQYDTLPIKAGLKMRMKDVDVATWQYVKNTYFSAGIYNISIYFQSSQMGKDTIDTDILLPMGCYGISRFGRASISVTKPPLPGIGKLVSLDWTNVINPQKIIVTRSSNSRTFYNLISYEYNYDVPTGGYTSIKYFLDTVSLNLFGDQVSQLPIQGPGLRDELSGALIAQTRGRALLNRYKNCCIQISITVNWSAGSTIEVSDIVKLTDDGNLKIMNFETGERNLGVQLFEVINRQYNIMSGNVDLTLLGGLGFSVDSRFGLYSPSTLLNSGSTSNLLRVTPSYGQTKISAELAKWAPYIGQPIVVHSYDYTVSGQTTIQSIGANDPTGIDISPALGFTPDAGYIIDIPPYPTSTSRTEQAQYKLLYAHLCPSVPVVSGVSTTAFNVDAGDISKFTVGNTLVLRNEDWSVVSNEVNVFSLGATLVTVVSPLTDRNTNTTFTPDNTFTVEGIGYKDHTNFYRWG